MGSILSLSIGVGSVAHGPLLGLFVLGMLIPSAKSKVQNVTKPTFCTDDKNVDYFLGCLLWSCDIDVRHGCPSSWKSLLQSKKIN